MHERDAQFGRAAAPPRRGLIRLAFLLPVSILLVSGVTGQAQAETLNGALATAYTHNPELEAARAQLRATDEQVPQARAGYRPTITAEAAAGYENQDIEVKDPLPRNLFGRLAREFNLDEQDTPSGYSITLNQPLFRGFQTINTVREAEANVLAARESLRSTEQDTLLNGATAYMDVFQDLAIVRLNENNVSVLTKELESNERRFKAATITATDLAQSKAQRAISMASLQGARAQLQSSRATYEEVIGRPASHLQKPPPLEHLLPNTLSDALAIAQREHPSVVSALFQEEAAYNAVQATRGKMLPEVNLQLKHEQEYDSSRLIKKETDTSVMVLLKAPLYQAGTVSSEVREAKQVLFQRQAQLRQARAQVRSGVISAWSQLTSARAQLVSHRASVSSNRVALKGTRREAKAGKRTVLDVLNAEQALLTSQVQLVTDDRDIVVASYTLLSAIGRLNAVALRLPVELYDAAAYYDFVRRKLWGTRVTPRH